jgi:hypothetical protein
MNDRPLAGRILLVPGKRDIELDAVTDAWEARGGTVRRLEKYWIKDPAWEGTQISVYGNQTFSLVLAQIYGLELVSPDDALLASLDISWTKRLIVEQTLEAVADIDFPAFIKPVVPKAFTAAVFLNAEELAAHADGLPAKETILVSGIVAPIDAEVRAFVFRGAILDMAVYEGDGDVAAAKWFLKGFLAANPGLPDPLVIDLLYAGQTGWAILEFNACWGAGLNGCDAEKVLPSIAAATTKAS